MWNKLKISIRKHWQIWLMGGLIVLIVIAICILTSAKQQIQEYSKGFVTQQAFDSMQKKHLRTVDSLRFADMLLGNKLDSVYSHDKIYLEQLLAEQEWFKNYEKLQYEKINSIRNVGSVELQRLYANFEE